MLRFVAFLDTLLVAGTLDARRDAAASSKVEDLDTMPLLLSRDSASGAPIEALPECRVVVASLADRAATLARGAVARLAGMDSEAAKRTLYRGATIFETCFHTASLSFLTLAYLSAAWAGVVNCPRDSSVPSPI